MVALVPAAPPGTSGRSSADRPPARLAGRLRARNRGEASAAPCHNGWMDDVRAYNRKAWDRCVDKGDRWTLPVSAEVIAAARRGEWEIVLTPQRPVPRAWFPRLEGIDVLCLASGGGQQAPILAAAGAIVTLVDNSPKQLAQDRLVADREGLDITLVDGDMRDLVGFAGSSFDLIINPCSNCFVEDVRPVWREAFRVLRRGGR